MQTTRIIKRYQNRKLYDTHQSCYVTLDEIAQIIKKGYQIQIIENKSGRDITYPTQIQILFDQEKKFLGPKNTKLLERVIKSTSGVFAGYIKELEQKLKIGQHESEEIMANIELNSQKESQESQVNTYLSNLNSSIETPHSLN